MASASAVDMEPIEVLIALHEKFDLMDFAGPCEAISAALHDVKDKESKAFEVTLVGADGGDVLSSQGPIIKSQMSFEEAEESIADYDVLIVLGGNSEAVLKHKAQPLSLISAFTVLQEKDPSKERTLLSVCTGSLFLAQQGVLLGLSATTHPYYIVRFSNICSEAAKREGDEGTDIQDNVRFVVNNLRFDVGNMEENPYVRRKSDARKVQAKPPRKGSVSYKESNTSRAAAARRAAMRLGGLRVITAGGVSAGVDAALYLISTLVSEESMKNVADLMQWTWQNGVVCDGLDV